MNAVADIIASPTAVPARGSFVLPADQRGYGRYLSTGEASSYIAGHPESVLTRQSSFNFHEYQDGREGFGAIRVFGDETFSGVGCGYNMHPHHNFVICAIVLAGELTHVNTVGNIDQLHAGDYYVFSAGSGGKHAELNLRSEDMNVIYVWFTPDELYRPPSYHRAHFDAHAGRNRLVTMIGDAGAPALPIPQDVRISRLTTDLPTSITYRPASTRHGVYAFVIEGGCEWNGTRLNRRDSAGIWGVDAVECTSAPGRSDVLFVETIM